MDLRTWLGKERVREIERIALMHIHCHLYSLRFWSHLSPKLRVWLREGPLKKKETTDWKQNHFCVMPMLRNEVVQSCPTLCDPHGLQPTRLHSPWNFPGKSTGVACHFLVQGIFLTQRSNLGLPHCRETLFHLSHQVLPNSDLYWRKWGKPLDHSGMT